MTEQVDEQKYGLEGIEQAAGYRPMQLANPDPPAEPGLTDEQLAHFNRPPPPEPIERSYNDVTSGERRPDNEIVELDRAARDISAARAAERLEIQKAENEELNRALDWLKNEEETMRLAATPHVEQQPVQPAQPEQQPALTAEQLQALPPEEQYAAAQAQFAEADRQLQAALADPIVRERIETEFNAVRSQAAAQVEQMKAAFQQGVAGLATEAAGLVGALFPELVGLNPQQLQGAIAVMAKSQPERVQQLGRLVAQSQNIVAAQQQQQAQAQQIAQQQYAQQLEKYTLDEQNKYEAAIARDRSPEQVKALKASVLPMVEKHYGISQDQFRALYNGQQQVDASTMMRSANFQLMLSDALSYRMSKEALPRAISRPVASVQRPGVSEGPRADPGEVSAALARFNQPGGNVGRDGLRNAAAIVAARRRG